MLVLESQYLSYTVKSMYICSKLSKVGVSNICRIQLHAQVFRQ